MKGGWVYIVTNQRNGTLYIGTANPFNLDPDGGPELIELIELRERGR